MTVLPQNTQKIFGKHGVRLQCIQCAAKRLQCVQWPRLLARREGFTTEHTERATPDTEHTEDFRKAWGSDFSVFSVPPEAASVCSVAKNCWHGGRVLPQNTQNGLTPDTEHTEDFRKAWGSDFSVFRVPPEAASVCSVAKTAGTEGGIPQNTQNGLTPDTEHTEGVGVVTT